ncbi:MAG: amidohydrolase family protein, partial [Bacillota bacterium]
MAASVTLIRGGTVLVQDGSRPGPCEFHAGWDVVVSGDRIAYAGPAGGAAAPPDCERIDASGLIVMPGFVNAHTHASMALLRGYAQDLCLQEWLETRIWPAEDRMTREDVYWGAMLA